MRLPRPPALVLLLALLAGCNLRFHEEWPETGARWASGRQRTVGGVPRAVGHWTFWYPDGTTKQAQGFFDHGPYPQQERNAVGGTRIPFEGRTKKWMMWDPEGLLLCEGIFKEGLRDDLWACFGADGQLCCTGYFEQGRPVGPHVTWIDGRRRDEHNYAEGLLDGLRVVRDQHGQVVWRGDYAAGELVSSDPPGEAPTLHLLEHCARAAEDGQRLEHVDSLGAAAGDSPRGGGHD